VAATGLLLAAPSAAGKPAPAAADAPMPKPEEAYSDAEDVSGSSSSEEEDEDPEEIAKREHRRNTDPNYNGSDYESDELMEMWDDDDYSDGEGPDVVWTEGMLERVMRRKSSQW